MPLPLLPVPAEAVQRGPLHHHRRSFALSSTLCLGFRSSLSATSSTPGRSLRRGFGSSTRPLRSRSTSPTSKKHGFSPPSTPRLCGISTVRSSTMSPVLTTLPREGITLSTLPSLQPTPPSGSSSKRSPSSTLRRSLNIYRWRRVVNQQRGPRSSGGCGKRSSSGSSRIMTPTPRLTSADTATARAKH